MRKYPIIAVLFLLMCISFSHVFAYQGAISVSAEDGEGKVILGFDDVRSFTLNPPFPPSPPYLNVYILEKEGELHRIIKDNDDELSFFVFVDYKTDKINNTLQIKGDFDDIPENYDVFLMDGNDKVDIRKKPYDISGSKNQVFEIRVDEKKIENNAHETDEEKTNQENSNSKRFGYDKIFLITLLIVILIILFFKENKDSKRNKNRSYKK